MNLTCKRTTLFALILVLEYRYLVGTYFLQCRACDFAYEYEFGALYSNFIYKCEVFLTILLPMYVLSCSYMSCYSL